MAAPSDIQALRLMINEPGNVEPWTDSALSKIIDENATLDAAAATIWRNKAANVAHLVNISEGGSSRSMGDLYKNYIAVASSFEGKADQESGKSSPRTRAAVRA